MSEEALVLVESHGDAVAIVTINRPKALNALNPAVLTALGEILERLKEDGVRIVIVTGAGKAFVAGADIKAMRDLDRGGANHLARYGQRILHLLARYPGVTIAAVNGFALGGGMELAMACDLIVAGGRARFGQPEVKLGVIPGFGGTQRLGRLVGAMRARELVFTGRMFGADEAVRIGLALENTGETPALDRAKELADTIGSMGPQAVRYAKRACMQAESLGIEVGLQEEAEFFGRCFDTADQTEGMTAFIEKRDPDFQGR